MSTQSYFGVDYGTRKIGIAVGQTLTNTAMGIAIIPVRSGEPDWAQLDQLVQRWKPNAFVVGMPYNMDGTESDMTIKAIKFAEVLSERYGKPWHRMDERLSTRAAREISRDNAEMIGKRYNDKGQVDAMAAQLLLESWFASQ
ncbi:MAG: Holliday junction resolvase RuvX [Pseudomonadota bacterium]